MVKVTHIDENMSNEEYHSSGTEIISSSYIKNVFKHSIAKAGEKFKGNEEALKFGTMFHDIMEHGLDGFKQMYSIEPEVPEEIKSKYKNYKLSNSYKEWKAKEIDSKDNLVSTYDMYRLECMYNNLINWNDSFKTWEETYDKHDEYSFFGECMGIRVRVRPDRFYTFNGERIYCIDFKTCQDITKFKWDIKNYAYDLQAVFYAEFLGIDPSNFFFVAVEKEFPFKNQIFGLSQQTVEIARKNLYSTIEKIKNKDYGVKNFEPIERV